MKTPGGQNGDPAAYRAHQAEVIWRLLEQGMRGQDVARAVGISPPTLSRWLRRSAARWERWAALREKHRRRRLRAKWRRQKARRRAEGLLN